MFILSRRLFPPVAADRHPAERERPEVSMIEEMAVHPGTVSVQQELCFVVRPDRCRCRPAVAPVESWIAGTIRPWGPAAALSVAKQVLEPARQRALRLVVVLRSALVDPMTVWPLVSQPLPSVLRYRVLVRAVAERLRVEWIQTWGAPSLVPVVVQGLVFWAWGAFSEPQPGPLKRLSFSAVFGSVLFQWRAAD
jgi:hypothetical protein